MKKFLAVFFTIALISNSSHATGLFVGADALFGNARHKAKNSSINSGSTNNAVEEDDKFNYGVNAGFRLDVLNLLASAELFYDNLNISSHKFDSSNNSGDRVKIDNRYGVKFNAGFAIFPRVTPFLTLGLGSVKYRNNSNSYISKSELSPLYGVGLLVDLPLGISLKAAYDYQQFDAASSQQNSNIKSHLGVARIGVVYNF